MHPPPLPSPPPQSIQSARLSVQSSELGPPLSPSSEFVSLPLGSWGGRHTRLRGRGRGDPIPTKGETLWYSLYTIITPHTHSLQLVLEQLMQRRQCIVLCRFLHGVHSYGVFHWKLHFTSEGDIYFLNKFILYSPKSDLSLINAYQFQKNFKKNSSV